MIFEFAGVPYVYADRAYNTTRVNERAVELPVAAAWIRDAAARGAGPAVEYGRVLDHYDLRRPGWDCIDLTEEGRGVINADLRVWSPERPLGAAVAVSTIEHVGWDWTGEYDEQQAVDTLVRLVGHLAPGGSMLVTIPVGCHPGLDRLIFDPVSPLGVTGATLVREGPEDAPTWRQTPTVEHRPYIGGGRGAGAVFIGQFGVPLL